MKYFVAGECKEYPLLHLMATPNALILLTATCTPTNIERESIVALPLQQWSRAHTTM
jgi:hypothetical protein